MARNRSIPEIEFVDRPPPRGEAGRDWYQRLEPLLKRPGQWARIFELETPAKAQSAQSNLSRRKVSIPEPEKVWEFAARGCSVYAIYRGGKERGGARRTQRVR